MQKREILNLDRGMSADAVCVVSLVGDAGIEPATPPV